MARRRAATRLAIGLWTVWLAAPLVAAQQGDERKSFQDEMDKLRAEMRAMKENYESRIQRLENKLEEATGEPVDPTQEALDELAEALAEADSSPLTQLQQTSRFNPAFNPAIGAVIDFSFAGSTLDDSFDDYNQFRLRVLELDLAAEVDPYTWAYVVLEFGPEEAGVAEAAAIMSLNRFLPESELRIKGGRFFLDLDPLNPIHEHDYSFVGNPAAKVAFYGGNVVSNGLELHHWFPVGDAPVRWSVGVSSNAEGETEAELAGEEPEDAPAFGERNFDDFVFTARVATDIDLGESDRLGIGGSVFVAPDTPMFVENGTPPPDVLKLDGRQVTGEVDVTWRHFEPDGDGFQFTTALFVDDREFTDEGTLDTSRETALGLYAYLDVNINQEWTVGGFFDWVQNPLDPHLDLFQYAAYVTWWASPQNRLRIQLQYTDEDRGTAARFGDDFFTFFFQWTVYLGTHAHGVDWGLNQ